MIFVTVGTHEQPFNRLLEKVDELIESGVIKEEVIAQTGYSTYEPKHYKFEKLIPYEDMQKYYREARIIITHGGPSSFIDALILQKTPIVVPRQEKFNEHINNHQLDFSLAVKERGFNLIVIDNIDDLKEAVENYSSDGAGFVSNNKAFNDRLEEIVEELVK